MKVLFRVDASILIGNGHVMRCLTLAQELRNDGYDCKFICRNHHGNLIKLIESKQFKVLTLNKVNNSLYKEKELLKTNPYLPWLGAFIDQDVNEVIELISDQKVDWIVVDHYAIDQIWERKIEPYVKKIMVIDDLANRYHHCNLLLDQTYGRSRDDYSMLISEKCNLLCGSSYAMIRPEFKQSRSYSLKRRSFIKPFNVLISLGGVDKDNVTSLVLESFCNLELQKEVEINVVMNRFSPWLEDIRKQSSLTKTKITVLTDVENLAELMANSDFAIGAAGATSWERCCLGLPSLVFILGENQNYVAKTLSECGAVKVIKDFSKVKYIEDEIAYLLEQPEKLKKMSEISASVVIGDGTSKVVKEMKGSRFR